VSGHTENKKTQSMYLIRQMLTVHDQHFSELWEEKCL